MADPRLASYASLLVERCIDVQPGWQVLDPPTPPARPLVEEVVSAIARRGAYALPRLSFARSSPSGSRRRPKSSSAELAEIDAHELDNADCFIVIDAPENTREGSDISPERLMLRRQATRPHMEPFFAGEKPWVGCQFPTAALAQDAGMGLRAYEDFLYGAVLVDWDALAERMREIGARFDAAGEVRDHRRRHRSHLQPRRPLTATSTRSARTCPAARSSTARSRTRRAGTVAFSEYPASLRRPRRRERPPPLRGRPGRRRVGVDATRTSC